MSAISTVCLLIVSFLFLVVYTIYLAYSKFFVSKEEEVVRTTVGEFKTGDVIIGAYIDGTYSSDFPSQTSGYSVEKVECDNEATGIWDSVNYQ